LQHVATDADGNRYRIVKLGSQVWLAENLRAEHSPTGDRLASFALDDDPGNIAIYGRLYPWTSAQRTCPAGWHLPSDQEWTALEGFLGESAASRSRDPRYWPAVDPVVADVTPFGVRPAGYSNDHGFETFFGTRAIF
jgi:uncharacterized protein (TIGR02145 family)